MPSSADILFWTKYSIPDTDAARYTAAAETRLNADGGSALAGEVRNQLLCYLIGDMIATSVQEGTSSSETIGDYSYSTSSTAVRSADFWISKYRSALAAISGAHGRPTADNGGIADRTSDSELISLYRRFADRRA